MKNPRLLILTLLAATGCVDGAMGEAGEPGAMGEKGSQGKRGERLVWKDADDATVDGSYVFHHVDGGQANLTMLVRSDDVLFSIHPLNGEPIYTNVTSANLTRYYQTANCSGPAFYVPSVTTPGLAFRFNNRIVALPNEMPLADTMGSVHGGSSCSGGSFKGAYIPATTLDELPSLTPPLLGRGPFHVEES